MILFDFSESSPLVRWGTINDGVMGGLSESCFDILEEGNGCFTGTVSLEHGGGFASIKTTPFNYNLGGYDGVTLRVKGDGKRYTFRARMVEDINKPAYEAGFETIKDEWLEVTLPFEHFFASFRGKVLKDAKLLDPKKIVQFGLMIKEKQEGAFRLEIARVEAWKDI